MDPQQELFSYLLVELKKLYPDNVYDTFLPPDNTPYPFIYVGNSQLIDDANKKCCIWECLSNYPCISQ